MTIGLRPVPAAVVEEIEKALTTWDRSAAAARVAEAEQLRLEFVSQFPLESWASMSLESYALGQSTPGGTVGWWLEFKTRTVGSMSGGSSHKHLIFKGADGAWKFPKQYPTVEEAWAAVRAGFVRLFDLTDAGQVDQTADITALYGAPALRAKALYMYFPDQFIPVCSFSHVHQFLDRLGQPFDTNWVLGSNIDLLTTLRSVPALADMSTQELGYFLYHWADPRTTTTVVKIAPGEGARLWQDCLEGGFICVGWDAVGDLSTFANKDEFRQAFGVAYSLEYQGHESTVSRKANELWTLMTLEPGDKVIANKGTSEILAIGTVTDGGYTYRPDRDEFRHTLAVEWDTSVARSIPPVGAWRTRTVAKVSAPQFRLLLGGTSTEETSPIAVDEVYGEIERALQRRGQVILYGPPGTGKTYLARRAAVWFLAGGTSNAAAAALLADDNLMAQHELALSTARDASPNVWFMVANPQQWTWEQLFSQPQVDYSFGRLQRNYPNVRAGDLVVGYESTPTKRVVALARVTGEYDPDGPPSTALTLEPVTRVHDGPTYNDLKADPLLSQSEPMRFGCWGTLFALTAVEADRLLTRLSIADPQLAPVAQSSTSQLTRVTFHPSYTYEDFVEGFRPNPTGTGGLELRMTDGIFKKVCAAAAAEPNRPFVILIDEINRGNIAKILGELITLIELDKRGLTVRLPQSGDEFHVPPNVYIIATMNTADRSIQLLDTALRRRFRFIELMPDSDTLEGVSIGGLSLGVFLDTLNDRIRDKVGRERQIGHALFFQDGKVISGTDEFAEVFRHELLPLVQEYLYDDYADLAHIFGSDVVDPDRERVTSHIEDPEALCSKLADHFDARAPQ